MSSSHPMSSQPEVRARRGFSLVWLIPCVAALVGAGLVVETLQSRGPTIRLTFSNASGLEAGKTKIKYRDVEVGVVTSIALSDDLQSVRAEAELVKDAAPYLSEGTRFWKVEPRVSLQGVSGLDTLVSGTYLGVLPAEGAPRRDFRVLDDPPITAEHRGALAVTLRAEELGGVAVGSPLTYRGVPVGEVERTRLQDDGQGFLIDAFVYAKHRSMIRSSTMFWNDSGLRLSVGAGGLQVQAASLRSLLSGGIALETPVWASHAEPAPAGATFPLHPSDEYARRAHERHEGLTLLVETIDAGGIAEGAPVLYRHQKVGHVGAHRLSDDAISIIYDVHIEARYAPLVRANSRFFNASGLRVHVGLDGLDVATDSLASLVDGGIAFATPDRPSTRVESGRMFALHEEPKPEWVAWAPRIWIGGDEPQRVAHVVDLPKGTPKGLTIELEAFSGASVKEGDAITYRELTIGRIVGRELSKDSQTVRMRAEIDAQYASLVRMNSRFWNTSGIHAHLGLSGLDIDTGSLESILAGGVALATPDEAGAPATSGTIFPLHASPEDEWTTWSPTIWRGPKPAPNETEKHAIARHHRAAHVSTEAVAPSEAAETTDVAADEASGPGGFFRRLFGSF